MAEKRVSVRLVAEGGRQVRAELEGIGEAGTRGFGRLSSEMELANARLGSFARKAGIALAAVTAAAAAAGVAMVRSGLDVIGAQADMAASLRTTVESLQVLTWAGELAGVSMGEIEQATKKLTTRLSEAAAGSGSAVGALQRLNLTAAELQALPLDQRIVAIQEALNQFVPEAERAAVASDLFGDRAALAFLRIDSATLREAAQDVQDFGVAVSAADAAQIERTGDAIAKLSLIWLGLTNRLTAAVAPALETVANALADMARGTGPIGGAINAVFDNLARLGTYVATFAAFMAGRWVVGLAVAALSVRGLATALVFLRGALIRTGIGALIVGAGELVYQFSQLVTRVGGVGEAFRLLGDLASEVWSRIGLALDAAFANMAAGWEGLKAAGLSALEGTIAGVVSFGDRTAAIVQGAYDAAVAIWGSLPGAIGDFAFQAANGLISGVEAMLNGVVTRINNFINGLNAALDLLPDWAVGEGGVRIGTLDPVELARITVDTTRIASESFPMAIPPEEAERRCRRALMEAWIGRESATFRLPPSRLALDPADVIRLVHDGRDIELRLVSIADSDGRGIESVRQDRAAYDLPPGDPRPATLTRSVVFGAPDVVLLDLPQISEDQPAHRPMVAAHAVPWPGEMSVFRSPSTDGFALLTTFGNRARIGTLVSDFYSGPTSRFDLGNALVVDLASGTLESVTDLTLFGGANALAVETAPGKWEIVQAGAAELIGSSRYRLTRLLRGQRGTEAAMGNPTPPGARVLVLDSALAPLPIAEADLGLPWNWRIGPAARSVSDASYTALAFTPAGRGLVPFAPVHVAQPWRTARSPGDLTIRWTRRSRALVADAWEQVEVPLAEDQESYDVQILDGAAVKRTLTSSTTSVFYTAAQQTADWGAPVVPGQTLAIRIYQLSNRLGRGDPAAVTLQF